jgi:hypothetical protein
LKVITGAQLNVRVLTDFRGFRAPFDVRGSVERLLLGIPSKYLIGLDAVILRDTGGFTRSERKKSQKDPTRALLGCYHRARRVTPPRIHLFVDNILDDGGSLWLRIPLIRDILLAKTLFHEVGHHIQEHIAPEYRERETTADAWSMRLSAHYFSARPHRALLVKALRVLFKILRPGKGRRTRARRR